MKPKTIEEIQGEVTKEKMFKEWDSLTPYGQNLCWPEVCKRYAIEVTKPISDLLAVMHGDGGHYTAKHGLVKSVEDAIELLHTKWKSPDQVRDACKASLEKASENVRVNFDTVTHKKFITDEQNIVL